MLSHTHTHTHTHPFNGPLSRTTRVSRYQKGKTSLDFTEARDSKWQWHQLGHMQVCTSLQTDNHTSTPLLSFLQAGCPSCRPTNSVKALKAYAITDKNVQHINKSQTSTKRIVFWPHQKTDIFYTMLGQTRCVGNCTQRIVHLHTSNSIGKMFESQSTSILTTAF